MWNVGMVLYIIYNLNCNIGPYRNIDLFAGGRRLSFTAQHITKAFNRTENSIEKDIKLIIDYHGLRIIARLFFRYFMVVGFSPLQNFQCESNR